MGAAFGIIPMGDDNQRKTHLSEDVYALHPVKIMTDPVYFIYRQCKSSYSQGRGAGSHQASALVDAMSQ